MVDDPESQGEGTRCGSPDLHRVPFSSGVSVLSPVSRCRQDSHRRRMAAHPGGGDAAQWNGDGYWCCITELSIMFVSTVLWLPAGAAHLSAVRPTSIHHGQHGRPAVCMQWRRGGVPPSPGTGRSRIPPAFGLPGSRFGDRPIVEAGPSVHLSMPPCRRPPLDPPTRQGRGYTPPGPSSVRFEPKLWTVDALAWAIHVVFV